ncbi:MAG: transposase [Deltaproteobacteria bacterium]|nr:transposase [Deltaproteobacteria bacterium]
MARIPLIHIPHGIYSVVSKCNNDEFHFDAAEKFSLYLQHLIACKRLLGFRMYDICCMSNHVHEMYVVPEKVTIATILQRVKGQFSRRYNARYGRRDHFWRNKPFYRIVQDERYVIASCAYYHNNPVAAGLVNDPADWPYSGYRFHVLGEHNGLIGELLDPIPGITGEQWRYIAPRHIEQVRSICQHRNARFIGEEGYVRLMKCTYRSDAAVCG